MTFRSSSTDDATMAATCGVCQAVAVQSLMILSSSKKAPWPHPVQLLEDAKEIT